MLTLEYRNLIDVLIEKTTTGSITWHKSSSRFSYQAKANENLFKVDKYFAGDDNAACLNLSVFDSEKNLLLELVYCRGIFDQQHDYEYLSHLYSRIEMAVNNGVILQEIPVVTSITQSLQQVV
jgi:hypothetical protein